jgi:hypothetical protein
MKSIKMTEQLPITIKINSELIDTFPKIKSVINKLEAQFNFHTLMANWYGDEEQVLLIQLALEIPESFSQCKEDLKLLTTDAFKITHFSDDVICSFNEREQQLFCHIALTESELELLKKQTKILAGFLQAKLHKVLNLIAVQQSLASI